MSTVPAAASFRLDIDPDIARAHTPPGSLYTDPDAYELIRRRILARSWQLVADLDRVKTPGSVCPVTLLEGCLDQPILLTRDKADALHCLSNVCTHRGAILCEHGGIEKSLVCRYHGRRFDLDGTFRHMPEFEKVAGFPSKEDSLARVPMAQWRQFLFASLEPASPLDAAIAAMGDRMAWLPNEQFRFDATRSREYLIGANWIAYCDNYLEGFHIPFVHAALSEALDYGDYRTECFPWSVLQLGIGKGGEHCFAPPAGSPDAGLSIAAYYWWLFPNMMFNFYPWGLSVNIVRPRGVDRTRVSYWTYIGDETKLDRGAGSGLDRVEREDQAVVESVQRGLRSHHYTRGRYSPSREQGVHAFHRMLASML